MIQKFFWIASLVLLTACGGEKKNEIGGKKGGGSLAVDVFQVSENSIPVQLEAPASILPAEEVQLYSEVSGRVKNIYFTEGKKVSKGELLIQMDVDILNAQKEKAEVDLTLAKKDEIRKKTLFQAKGVSQEEYEKSEAALGVAQAALDLINVQLSKAQVRAPFSGRVGFRQISEGAYVTPSTLLTTLIQDDEVKIEFAVPELYSSRVQLGQVVSFFVADGDKKYQAKVYAYQPFVDAATRMLSVRAKLKNDGKIIPGSFVSLDYDLGMQNNAIMVPAQSIIPVLKGQKIWLIRNGKVHGVPVELGVTTATQVQVKGDVKPGDKVVISGLLAVDEGTPVNVKSVQK